MYLGRIKCFFKILIVGLVIISVINCNNIKNKNAENIEAEFNLKDDIFEFSSTMNNNDTVIIKVNLANCEWSETEINYIIKQGDSIILSSVNERPYSGKTILDSVHYEYSKVDTLNFEDYFRYVSSDTIINNKHPFIMVLSKTDTLYYYSENLNDLLINLGYYISIKRKYYPNSELYKVIEIPEEPIQPETNIEYSIVGEVNDTIKL